MTSPSCESIVDGCLGKGKLAHLPYLFDVRERKQAIQCFDVVRIKQEDRKGRLDHHRRARCHVWRWWGYSSMPAGECDGPDLGDAKGIKELTFMRSLPIFGCCAEGDQAKWVEA